MIDLKAQARYSAALSILRKLQVQGFITSEEFDVAERDVRARNEPSIFQINRCKALK